jgi:CDP-diacylglycerol--glycerol-3-phosphate 3-phosphatidyltransferase
LFLREIKSHRSKANGFYGSKGLSGRIPEGYTLFEKNFMSAVYKAGRNWHIGPDTKEGRGVSLREWERTGWTYHAKGDASAGRSHLT